MNFVCNGFVCLFVLLLAFSIVISSIWPYLLQVRKHRSRSTLLRGKGGWGERLHHRQEGERNPSYCRLFHSSKYCGLCCKKLDLPQGCIQRGWELWDSPSPSDISHFIKKLSIKYIFFKLDNKHILINQPSAIKSTHMLAAIATLLNYTVKVVFYDYVL